MSEVNYKFHKYQTKMNNISDPSKKNIYLQKMKYYLNLEEKVPTKNLKKPEPLKMKYERNINIMNPINTIGYGVMKEGELLQPISFERRPLRKHDVLIEIYFCGVCHTDWHIILNEWKNSTYPVVAGHEMTGIVLEVGSSVTKFKKNSKVALTPNYNSCRICERCNDREEQYCLNGATHIYNANDRLVEEEKRNVKPTGPTTYGGYSNLMVVDEYFLFSLPEGMPMDRSAPLLCAGLTMYTPIKNLKIKEGQKLGIAGIGGLGHLGIKIGKAFGARVTALTTTLWKLKDSKRLGADESILVKDTIQMKKNENTLDFIIDTIPFAHDLNPYINLLKTKGILYIIGPLFPQIADYSNIIPNGKVIMGSNTGGTFDTEEMLKFCSTNNILPEINIISFEELNGTHDELIKSSEKAKYRFVIDVSSIYK